MTARKNLVGERFGRLVVIKFAGISRNQKSTFMCRCDCGNETVVIGGNLCSGIAKSCGCLRNQRTRERMTTHGMSHHPAYGRYALMLDRCYNTECDEYHNYGGRGIYVCDRWRKSIKAFLQDVGEPPSHTHSIDRINNDGPYEPENCRWATKTEQNINRRVTKWFRRNDVVMCESEWSKSLGMKKDGVSARLRRGWDLEKALTTPAIPKGKYSRASDSYRTVVS